MNKSFYNLPCFWLALISLLFLNFASLESYAYDLKEYSPLQVRDNTLFFETGSENGESGYQIFRYPVSMTETIQGVETFIVGELSGDCWNKEYGAIAWDNEGFKVYRLALCLDGDYEVTDFDIPLLMMPRQLDLGEKKTWTSQFEVEFEGISIPAEITSEAILEAVEDVTVFPGTVLSRTYNNSLRVLMQRSGRALGQEVTSGKCRIWAAKGIGEVKRECTETENGTTSSDTSQLIAARVGDSLIGSPLRTWQGEVFSFYLSQITISGCDMMMDNIVIVLEDKAPEFWWIKFTLDLKANPVAWIITDFGQGIPPVLNSQSATTCPIPGLDFSQALHKINIDNLTLDPQLWMRVPFGDQNFKLGFDFPVEKLSWELYFIDLLQ